MTCTVAHLMRSVAHSAYRFSPCDCRFCARRVCRVVLALCLSLWAFSAALAQTNCCKILRNAGQKAFDQKDYAKAIEHWTKGQQCSDAANCPDLKGLVRKAQEAADWEAAQRSNTAAAYGSFLSKWPNGTYAAEARKRRDRLQEAADWDSAQRANTAAAYGSFLSKWPNGANAAEARKRRDALGSAPATNSAIIQKLEADMVLVEGGTFTMGCLSARRDGDCFDEEKPWREVRVSDFYIGKYEVTQAQWRAVMGSDPPELYNKGCDDCPVEGVSWDDVQAFLKRLNALTGKRYRLLTEAEWEYAARGGRQGRGYMYSGSNNLDEVGWYDGNYQRGKTYGSQGTTRPVGQKKANELGLYDMSGNVWEWVEDDWHDDYRGAPRDGRAWVDSPRASYRVYRGGSWCTTARYCRAAYRHAWHPAARHLDLGFRARPLVHSADLIALERGYRGMAH